MLAVLAGLAHVPTLWRDYVVKGGFALHHVYGSPRWSDDLDFTAVRPFSNDLTEEKNELLLAFCSLLDEGLAAVAPGHGFETMRVCWKHLSDEFPACLARIGYADAAVDGDDFAHIIEMQVTLSEVICETVRASLEGIPVHVPSLEDILAEKLKALVQQVQRRRGGGRPNDVYDVWYFTSQSDRPVKAARVAEYLLIKSAQWESLRPLTRARFRDPAVRAFSRTDYDDLRHELPPGMPFPSYDEAFDQVLAFVATLNLPDA